MERKSDSQRDLFHPYAGRKLPAGEEGDGVEVRAQVRTPVILFILCSSLIYGQDIVTDTLSYRDVSTDSLDLYLGEIGLIVHEMPVEGKITGLNIPIASWGDSSGGILVEMYKLNYPLDSTGYQYDNVYVNENGWLGYYPNQANDSLLIPYVHWSSSIEWNAFGDTGVCTGVSPALNTSPPLSRLIWYGDFAPATIDPTTNSIGDNWLVTADWGPEYEFNQGDYIGIFIKYYREYTTSPISFFAGYNTEYNDPWRFLLFSPQCGGISGEGGWHIRSVTVNCELEIEYTSLRAVEGMVLPTTFQLHQNHPNPFNPLTTIRYDLPTNSHVRLSVYDILGRAVAVLTDTDQNPGSNEVQWNASSVPSGIYFIQMQAGEFRQVRKVMVLK